MTVPANNKRRPKSSRARKRRLAAREKQALSFETLESRQLLASVTVSNATDVTNADTSSITALIANDGGDGISLREAVQATNNTAGEDTITFDGNVFTGGASSVIRLTQGELSITDSLTIDGASATDLVVSGDANGDDATEPGTFITDVSRQNPFINGQRFSFDDDNSRVINFSDPFGDLNFNSLTLTGGESSGGGAVRFDSSGTLSGTNVTISGNEASAYGDTRGGGISTQSGGVVLVNSTLTGNIADSNSINYSAVGGAIYAGPGSSISATGVLINENRANGGFNSAGGGISSLGGAQLTNSTVSGNGVRASYSAGAGGIDGVNIYLTNSTVANNGTSAVGMSVANPTSFGGGVSASGALSIINSIVASNGADVGPDVSTPFVLNGPPFELTAEHSLIGDTTGSGIDGLTGNGNILNQPALLGPLADNGGPTLTHPLLTGSPAIDAGNDSLAVDASGVTFGTDQRGTGFDRFAEASVDIGAFEVQDSTAPAPTVVSAMIDQGDAERPDLWWNSLTVIFDQDVTVTRGDLSLFNDSLGGGVSGSRYLFGADFSYDSTTYTATWDFTTNSLDPGFYTWSLDAGSINSVGQTLDGDGDGTGGDDFVGQQHYLAIPGDANLDGVVDVLNDAFALVGSLGSSSGATWAQGDFNADGSVDALGDAFILVGNLNRDVRPTGALSTAKTQSAASAIDSVAVTSTPVLIASDADNEQDKSFFKKTATTTEAKAKAPALVLAGDHDLRDGVFGSDF